MGVGVVAFLTDHRGLRLQQERSSQPTKASSQFSKNTIPNLPMAADISSRNHSSTPPPQQPPNSSPAPF
jgi:hypothetical protein